MQIRMVYYLYISTGKRRNPNICAWNSKSRNTGGSGYLRIDQNVRSSTGLLWCVANSSFLEQVEKINLICLLSLTMLISV